MRRLIILYLLAVNLNSYCQENSNHYNLLKLDDSITFRLKKVELYANRIFGPEVTKEKYYMFEFPNDTSTLLVFANRIKKRNINKSGMQITFSQLNPKRIGNDLILVYSKKYYHVCTKPNSLVTNKLFFTKAEKIFLEGRYFEFLDKNVKDSIYKYYNYKYGIPSGKKRLKFDIVLSEKIDDEFTLTTNSYDSDYNPPDYIYKKGKGIYKIFGYLYYIETKKAIKTSYNTKLKQ